MQVVLQLSAELAASVRNADGRFPESLRQLIETQGGQPVPPSPPSGDPSLDRYFYLSVPDPAAAEALCGALRAVDGVEAAYVKPLDAPP